MFRIGGLPWPVKILLIGWAYGLAPFGTNLKLLTVAFLLAAWVDGRVERRRRAAAQQ
jgi:hypothetical protein